MDLVQNQDQNQFLVRHAEDTVKSDRAKVFLQYNKHARSVLDLGNKFLTPVKNAVEWVKNSPKKKYLLIFQKVLMMVQELDYQAKEKQV